MHVGRTLIIAGLSLAALGLLWTLGERLPIKPGRLPGDIVYRGKNTTVYVPLMTCLLLSLAASFVLWILRRFR